MNIRSLLQVERQRLLRNIQEIDKKLSSITSPGKILFERNGQYWKWRQAFPETGAPSIILPKSNRALAEELSLKRLLTEQRDGYYAQVKLIDRFLEDFRDVARYPDPLNEQCPDYRKLLSSHFTEKDRQLSKWMASISPGTAGHPENLIHPTKSGILVRSKSEVLIADALFDRGKKFFYEITLHLKTMTIHPDFAILEDDAPTGLVLWEHCGMMDSEEYMRVATAKTAELMTGGFIPGKNLILTYETRAAPLDINYVELLISHHFR